jgi:hypothetical protein
MAAKNNSTLKIVALISMGYIGYKYLLRRTKTSPALIEDPIQDHVQPIEEIIINPVIPVPPEKQEIEPDPVSPIKLENKHIPSSNLHVVTVPVKHEIVNPGFTSASKAHKKEIEKLKSKTFIDDILDVKPTLTNKHIDVTPKEQIIRNTNTVAQKPLIVVKQEAKKKELATTVEHIIHKMPTGGKVSQRTKSFSSKISY